MNAILLAAGSAERFGSQKLLARLPDGRFVVEAAAKNLMAGAGSVIAVTARDEKLVRVLEDCGCQVVVNDTAAEGMGTSIAAGVRATAVAGTGGWLIALGDMPAIRPVTIASVCNVLAGGAGIVIPAFEGRRGHPVGFSADFADELMALHEDSGARGIVAAHGDRVVLLPVNDPGVLADIDTPDDLKRVGARCHVV